MKPKRFEKQINKIDKLLARQTNFKNIQITRNTNLPRTNDEETENTPIVRRLHQ